MSVPTSNPDARDYNAELVAALSGLSEPLLAVDFQRRIYYANRAGRALLGIERATLPDALVTALADRELVTALDWAIDSTGQGSTGHSPHELPWRHGQQSYAVRVQAVDTGHLILFLRVTPGSPLDHQMVSDTTHRFWATALAGMGSWTWGVEDRRLRSNSIPAGFTGLDSVYSKTPALTWEHIHPDDRAGLGEALLQATERPPNDPTGIDLEIRFNSVDQRETWLAMRGGVVRNAGGEPVMLAGIHFDITERKRAEQAASKAKQALEEANRAKDDFLAKVSHEIRSPLTTILGYTDLCLARAHTEEDRTELGQILDSAHYLQRLVDDLLDLSRVITGKIAIDRQSLDPRQLGEELMSSMQLRAAEQALRFTVKVDPKLPGRIWTDPVRVRQILHNLAGNAIKFTQHGEVSVRIFAWQTGPKPRIAFEVRDTGPGIARHELDELFEPSAYTRGSDSARLGGLGLGLGISRRLARMLGGDITVETQLGHGSVFTLELPLTEAEDGQESPSSDRLECDRFSRLPALCRRVLVVDEAGSIRTLLHEHLGTAGADVVTAEDADLALAYLASAERSGQPFDAILIGRSLPEPNGDKTLQRLRAAGHAMPAVALSASAMKGEREQALNVGFAGFIAKPFSALDVVNAIVGALENGDDGEPPAGSSASQPLDTLLLVEDDEALARLTAEQLSGLGYRVEVAHSAAAAIDRARALAPSALIIDLSLPDMDGIELCRVLRLDEALAACRMIAYTGSDEPEQHAQAREAGFADVLIKPAPSDEFAASLSLKP